MEFDAWSLLTDFGFVCVLLLFGKLLRAKIRIFQAAFLPAAITAGLVGLLLGPNVLGIIPFSDQISVYPAILIAVIFAALPLGQVFDLRAIAGRVGALWAYSQAMMVTVWGLGLLFGILVLNAIWDLPDGFGLLLGSGFVGGHGTAAAVGTAFGDLGWEEASSLAFTAATVGVLVALFGGLALIKWGASTGKASNLASFDQLSDDLKTGLVNRENRRSVGDGTVSPVSIEPLTFHLGIILGITLAAYYLGETLQALLGDYTIPTFALAFLVGLCVQLILLRSRASEYVDRRSVSGITGTSTDFLVAFGIASIVPTVVADFLLPLILLLVFGILYCLVLFRYLAPLIFSEYWFEKGVFTWGWSTGAVAMGIALLRIVDPDLESKTLDDFGIAYVPIAPVEVAIVSFAPLLVFAGYSWPLVVATLAFGFVALLVSRLFGWWSMAERSE